MIEGENGLLKAIDPYYGELIIDRNDIILRHQEDRYDHLRAHFVDKVGIITIKLCFMEQRLLGIMSSEGIAEAHLATPTTNTIWALEEDFINRLNLSLGEKEGFDRLLDDMGD